MKKKYSVAIREKDSDKFKVISWKSFEEKMKERETNNVVFIPIAEKYDHESSTKLLNLSELMMNQYIIHVIDYYLIDHRKDTTMPCITFFFPNMNRIIADTLIYSPLKFFIQVTIAKHNKAFQIIKRPFLEENNDLNFLAN